jgi:sugar phosphate isomerase/epimerase
VTDSTLRLGILARTFAGTVDEIFAAVRRHDLSVVQFNFSLAGLATVPEQFRPDVAASVAETALKNGIEIAAVSGTFNLIDPDRSRRSQMIEAFDNLCRMTRLVGAGVVTLCSGTRHAHNMWAAHPDNDAAAAWDELVTGAATLCRTAADHDVVLAVEPELANVVSSAAQARRLIDEIASPHLRVLLDPANLIAPGQGGGKEAERIIDEAFDVLCDDIALVHAKDVGIRPRDGYVAAGRGSLDYHRVADALRRVGYIGPVVMHELGPDEVAASVAFIRASLAIADATTVGVP